MRIALEASPRPSVQSRKLLIPVIAIIAMTYMCLDHRLYNHNLGHIVSRNVYKLYLIIGVGILALTSARQPQKHVLSHSLGFVFWATLFAQGSHVFHLPRPGTGPGMPHAFSPGFPSGHTCAAFGLAWLLMEFQLGWPTLWFAIAAVVGWSRVSVNMHYPYQVFAGALYGCVIAYLCCKYDFWSGICRRFSSRKHATAATK